MPRTFRRIRGRTGRQPRPRSNHRPADLARHANSQNSHVWSNLQVDRTEQKLMQIGGSARIIFVGVRHLASHDRSAVSPAGQALPCRYRIR